VGEKQVLPESIDQRAATVEADEVARQRTHQLAHGGQDDDNDQVEVVRFVGDLAAGQDAAVDDGQLGTDRQTHRRDEAERENGNVAPGLEKVLHGPSPIG
jgi:hypothetical protein